MARQYVNPNHRAVPDSPEALAEYLASDRGMRDLYGPGGAARNQAAFQRAYVKAVTARDPSIGAQLREQLGAAPRAARGWPGNAAERLYRPEAPGAKVDGMFAHLGDFVQAARKRDPRMGLVTEIQNSFGSEVPDAGGFLIPEEFRSDLLLASLEQSVVRPLAIVFPSTSLRIGVPAIDDTTHASSVLGGVIAYWAEEAATLTEAQATYQRVILDAKKLVVYSTAPNELMQDAAAFDVYLRQTLPAALAWWQDKAFIEGTGVGEPEGYRSAACQIKVSRTTSSHINLVDATAMLSRLLPQSLMRAVWVCSPSALVDMLNAFQNFGSATSGVIPPSKWIERTPDGWTLLGMPLKVTEHAAALGSLGDLSLVDLGMYLIADREVGTLDISPHFKFSTDVSALRLRSRVDGKYWLQSAVTPENGSTTLSGVVILN